MAPGVSPCRPLSDDDQHTYPYCRAVIREDGREKQILDPAWNERIAALAGRDIYGNPLFRAAWGWNELQGNGELRYPHVPFQYLLLRRFPASAWGTRLSWYLPRLDDGEWAPSYAETFGEEYPWQGAEEIDFAFPKGVPFNLPYIEHRLRLFSNRPKLPDRAQRMRDYRREAEAKEQETWTKDYEQFRNAGSPFGGNPFVGFGSKSGEVRSKVPEMPKRFRRKFNEIHADRIARFARQGKRIIS